MPSGDRLTVCVSSQVGCAMACSFCATGKEGFTRNLLPGEIVEQVLIAQNDMGTRVSNAVIMGQGESFLNYGNTLAPFRFLNGKDGLNIGARHITVSDVRHSRWHSGICSRTRAVHSGGFFAFRHPGNSRCSYASREKSIAFRFYILQLRNTKPIVAVEFRSSTFLSKASTTMTTTCRRSSISARAFPPT